MNQFKTLLLLSSLTGLLLALGYFFGGRGGVFFALIVSAVMNFVSYWFSDKIVLSMYGAQETTAAEAPQLHRIVEELSVRAGIQKPRVYILNMPSPNAFATGRDDAHGAVAVSPSLLQLLSEGELRGVLAHELGHIQNRDILVSSVAATLAGAISSIAQMAYYAGMITGFGGRDDEHGRGNALGAIALLILTPIIATLLHLAVSRSREYLADETGARISGAPWDLANALKKLQGYKEHYPLSASPAQEATSHLFIVNPFSGSLIMSLLSTHPPMEERIARLMQMR